MLWADSPTKRLNNRIIVLIDFILITLNIKHYYRIPYLKERKKAKNKQKPQATPAHSGHQQDHMVSKGPKRATPKGQSTGATIPPRDRGSPPRLAFPGVRGGITEQRRKHNATQQRMLTGTASTKGETHATAAKESRSGGKEATKAPFTTAWLSQVSEVTKPQAQQPAVPSSNETAGTAPVSHQGDRGSEARQAREHPFTPSGVSTCGRPRTGPTTAKSK